ncbi:O-antigen ligase family protein [bacterium]|nr:O-antigen ligase family protein [bacterium]
MAFAAHPAFVRLRPRASAIPALSRAEWGLWLLSLALVARLTILSRRRSLEEFAIVDRFALLQILIIAASIAVVVFSTRSTVLWRRIAHGASGLLIGYYLFGALSSLWSPQPAYSLYRSIEAVSQIAIIHLALSKAPGFPAAERRALIAVLASMLLGMISVITTLGFEFRFDFWHTNQYSVPAMLAFTYAFGELFAGRRSGRPFLYAVAVAGFIGMAIGTSSASFIAAFCGMIVTVMLSRTRPQRLFAIVALIGLVGLLGGGAAVKRLVFYGKSEAGIERLSGRAYFWQGYMKTFSESPLVGQGFAVSARISSFWRTTNTHNAILSVLLGTGLVGLALAARAVLRWAGDGLRATRRRQKGSVGCAAAISAGLVNSMSVAFLGETWMMSSFSFVCMLALFSLFIATDISRPVTLTRRAH